MAIFIEKTDTAFNLQLKNFANKISNYSAALGLTAAEVTAVKADAAAVDYVFGNQLTVQTFAQNYTAFKNQLRTGSGLTLGALPTLPAFAAAPALPAVNVENRFRNLLQRITHSPNYTTAMGQDMGIEASATVFTPADGKPIFDIELSSGGHPNLLWTRGKFQGVEIWKDSGIGFVKLDRDMRPDYIDKTNLPVAGATAVWKYKMIYLVNDEVVGSWSDVVSVTVQGEV
jgi:hypothetical protein